MPRRTGYSGPFIPHPWDTQDADDRIGFFGLKAYCSATDRHSISSRRPATDPCRSGNRRRLRFPPRDGRSPDSEARNVSFLATIVPFFAYVLVKETKSSRPNAVKPPTLVLACAPPLATPTLSARIRGTNLEAESLP